MSNHAIADHPGSVDDVLAVVNLTKDYPATRALDGVSLGFRRGEVHGLIGENGAGKSTLVKILAGLVRPTRGTVRRDGAEVDITSPLEATRLRIAMVHQELNLIDELSVADNIFLGRERASAGFIRARETRREAARLLREIGCDIDPREIVRNLSIAQQQMVEIAKALSCEAQVLILDEPTAVLTRREVGMLFNLIRRLRADGRTILYISHILPEVLELCDRITVLRDGKMVRTLSDDHARRATEEQLAQLMVGREMQEHFPTLPAPREKVVLRVEGLSVAERVDDATFEVREGEIFGFAGLVGAGRTELAEAIAGLRRRTSGRIMVNSRDAAIRSPRDAVRRGIAYLSEDRKGRALTVDMDIVANTTMVSLKRYCHPFISHRAEEAAARAHATRLYTRYGRLRDPVHTLSGGNQQKVALAKWLEIKPRVLILDEPTRGIDIGAKEEIYRLIVELATQGMACVFISSELNEILGMCHRVAVMRMGRIVRILERDELSEERVMYHAAVAKAATPEETVGA